MLPNLLLSLAAVLFTGGALEGLARWLEPGRPPAREDGALPNWKQGWGADFYTIETEPIGWPPRRRFSNEGLRDRSRPLEKADGTWRVICLGDSVTFGQGINPGQAYPQALETRLRTLGRDVDVFNMALPAWSTRQQVIAYQRIARKYRPDQVLLGVCLNDIPELTNNLDPPPALLSYLHRRSAVVRRVMDAPGLEQRSVLELFSRSGSAGVAQAFDRFFAEVRTLRQEASRDGASLALVVFPFRFQLEPGAPPPLAQERILAFCAAEGLPCLDLLPSFQPVGPAAFLDHDHLTPMGADLAARRVLETGLVAAGPSAGDPLAAYAGPGGAPAASALAAALADPSERVRLAAARALGHLGAAGAPAMPALFAALKDSREAVRWAAAEALSSVGVASDEKERQEASIPSLVHALDSHDLQVRAFAIWTLGRIGPAAAEAVPALAGLLRHGEPALRPRVAQSLGGIGPASADAVPSLVAALQDPSESLRLQAARALGRIGAPARAAIPALSRAKGDGDSAVAQEARRALERIGPAS